MELVFSGSSVFMSANGNQVNSNVCEKALQGWQSVEKIRCHRDSLNSETGAASYIITFLEYPLFPQENNLWFHEGNPSLNLFSCNDTLMDHQAALGPYCMWEELSPALARNATAQGLEDGMSLWDPLLPLPLYKECSQHGRCDRTTGICSCEKGFHGPACQDITDQGDIVHHAHDGPFFTGKLLRLTADRNSHSNYHLFWAENKDTNITSIRGDG